VLKRVGPNGFNFNFIKSNWEILGMEFTKVVLWLCETGFIPKGCNASFITLIPKCDKPSKLDDFRPISLVGVCIRFLLKF